MQKKQYERLIIIGIFGVLFFWFRNSRLSSPALQEEGAVTVLDLSDEGENAIYAGMSFQEVMEGTFDEFGVDSGQAAVAYYHFGSDEHYYHNEEEVMYAASTTKVTLAALFVDLIKDGELSWDTQLAYSDSDYEEGEGNITNSEKKESYSIEELMDEMLLYSDNTATNVLSNYYIDYYSSSVTGYREAVSEWSGLENLNPQVYEGNYATAEMLEQVLIKIAADETYKPLTAIMLEAQKGFRFKEYIPDQMAAKYGSFDGWQHDIGIYYEGEKPVYVLVVLTEDVEDADEFLGVMNLRVNEWTKQNKS